MNFQKTIIICLIAGLLPAGSIMAQDSFTGLKAEAVVSVDSMQKLTQEIVDSLFSFSELGFQEFETQRYLAELLKENDFDVELGVAGIPSSWWASWGSGEPVIALGSDVDGIPRSSQMPGVAFRQPMIEGAPGHGEGHNSGQAVNIVAALAVKELMERENLSGTIVIWPGIAEELLGTKAWYARDGLFDGVNAVLFTHVSNNLSVSWGRARGTGLVSVEYLFDGEAAHGAGDPWEGRSALDAVELMNIAWNFRREHLHPLQRSHYVISNGGDQPNVVPSSASVWYFIREVTADGIRENFNTLHQIAEGASLMSDTSMSRRIIGAAYPRHFNQPIAIAMDENIQRVGLPQWSEDDQQFARALQKLMGSNDPQGLATELSGITPDLEQPISGGSDDIGDVSWNVPTVTLRFPSNVRGLQGHHWSSAMAMATPIAHKGAIAGAKVVAATMLDLLQSETLVEDAQAYFDDIQTADEVYTPFIGPNDPPAIEKNGGVLERAGHTEASVDISKLAKLNPSAVICEVMNEDGTMARYDDLIPFAKKHRLKIARIEDLISYRLKNEKFIRCTSNKKIKIKKFGNFDLKTFRNKLDGLEHYAITKGKFTPSKASRVRVISTNILNTLFNFNKDIFKNSLKHLNKFNNFALILVKGTNPNPSSSENNRILRYYGVGAQIIKELKIKNMILVSRSKKRVIALKGYGIKITKQEIIK